MNGGDTHDYSYSYDPAGDALLGAGHPGFVFNINPATGL